METTCQGLILQHYNVRRHCSSGMGCLGFKRQGVSPFPNQLLLIVLKFVRHNLNEKHVEIYRVCSAFV